MISFPPRVDARGTLVTTSDRDETIRQSIIDIIETRQGERVMLPDYGIPDFAFESADAGFGPRVAYIVERQIVGYVPLVKRAVVKSTVDDEGQVWVDVAFWLDDSIDAPGNLVYPIWGLKHGAV